MIETLTLFGLDISMYYLFWFIGAIAVLILGCRIGKHLEISFARSLIYVAGAIILGYLLLWGTSWLFGGGKMIGLNFIRIVIFMPIPVYLLTRIFGDSFGKLTDLVAPLLAVFHGVTHLGCMFPGCCHGYPSTWGLYSNEAELVCFPIQPIEAVSSILVGVVLMAMMRRNIQTGKLYAWYLLLYGGTRFIWEFFRDNEKVWFGISELAAHAFAAMLIGAVVLIGWNLLRVKHGQRGKVNGKKK